MTKEEVFVKFKPIFLDVFMLNEINIHSDLDASQVERWDSLTHMILITKIEKEFKIKFNLSELVSMQNVGVMAEIVMRKIGGL